jgi:hypothetical protein
MFDKNILLGIAQIKNGAIVGQDHGYHRWENKGEVFEVLEFIESRHQCRAYGYGILNTKDGKGYGNGILFVKPTDLIWQHDCSTWPDSPTVLG